MFLYKSPGAHSIWGCSVDYVITEDEAEIADKLANGWSDTPQGAQDAANARAAEALRANTHELSQVEATIAGLKAVHKGRGSWEVQDADGNVVESGLTKEEAQAKAA